MVDPALIARLSVFRHCSDAERDALALSSVVRAHRSGDILFRAGRPREDFFVLVDGDIRITSEFFGREQSIVVYHAGVFIGLQALLDDPSPHTTSAVVLSPSATVLEIRREAFRIIAREHPTMLGTVLAAAAVILEERLQYANRKLFALYTVARILRSTHRVRAAAAEILHVALTATQSTRALFVLRDPVDGILKPVSTIGYGNTSAFSAWVGRFERDGVIGAVCRDRQPRIISQPDQIDPALPYASTSMLVMPLVVGSACVGILLLADREHKQPFAENSRMVVEAIAQQLTDALERGRLVGEQEAARDLHRVYVGAYTGT